MKLFRRFIRDKTGEGYVDVAITIIIVFTLMASFLAVFPIFTAHQSMNNTARQLARMVEVTGSAGDEVQSFLGSMTDVKPDSIEWDTTWQDEAQKTIQLKTPFTVTVHKKVSIVILRPALGDPVAIYVDINASASGVSEVYWK